MKAFVAITIVALSVVSASLASEIDEDVDYSKLFDVAEGDILIPKGSNNRVAWRNARQLFPNGVVPYTFHPYYPQRYIRNIEAAMKLLESNTCVRFVPRTNQRDYVMFINDKGCYSMVGRVGGRQPISLDGGCQEIFVAAHEMMHALGIFHEQSRPDRDQYISINYNNVDRAMAFNFDKQRHDEVVLHRKFDFKSIMLYDPYIFSNNGRPTMVSKVAGQPMLRPHQKPVISEGDVQVIRELYKCNAENTNPIDANRPKEPEVTQPRPKATRRPQPTRRPEPSIWDRIFGRDRDRPTVVSRCPPGYEEFGRWCIPKMALFD
jgi:hypothetical protein